MSRAILTIALARTLHRQPSDAELTEFLFALRDLAGDRVYIPQRAPSDPEQVGRVLAMHGSGESIRKIARAEGISKSQVHNVLSTNPALFVDTDRRSIGTWVKQVERDAVRTSGHAADRDSEALLQG